MSELDVGELIGRADRAATARWAGARITDLEPLPGGVSSLTFSARLQASDMGARRVVVKVAPPGLEPVRNRDVLRQARVLNALHTAGGGVNVPEVLLQDAGSPPFFVMQFVAGDAFEPKWDVSDAPPAADLVKRRARAAAIMLARLQQHAPHAVGLGSEPVLSPADELGRWAALYATVGEDLRGEEQSLQRALRQRIPDPAPARILHGDYRMGNMQFDGDRLAAIIDWEIWSIGDPRHDIAWLMAFADPIQQLAAERDPANQAAADAMPTGEELLDEYLRAGAATEPPPELDWFLALCYYKLGATMSALAKRNRRLAEPDPGLERIAQTTPPMIARALEILA